MLLVERSMFVVDERVVSPAAKASGADASAIQHSAAAIGVRLSFIVSAPWGLKCGYLEDGAFRAPGPARSMQRLFPQTSGIRATLFAPHLVGDVIRAHAEIALVVVMLAAAGARAMRLSALRRSRGFLRLAIAGVDLRASIRVLH
jgi:hypothetical protein